MSYLYPIRCCVDSSGGGSGTGQAWASGTFTVTLTAPVVNGLTVTLPNAPRSEHDVHVIYSNGSLTLDQDFSVSSSDIALLFDDPTVGPGNPIVLQINYQYNV